MAFKVQDLAVTHASEKEDDYSWIVLIGCGGKSAITHGNTQAEELERLEPIDFRTDVRTLDDLDALEREVAKLQDWINEKRAGGLLPQRK